MAAALLSAACMRLPQVPTLGEFTLPISGQKTEWTSTDYEGKPVLIVFMGSWCPYCKMAMPFIDAAHENFGGVEVIRQKADAGQQICKEHAVHVTAHKLKKAADAGLAGGVLFDTLPGLEIVGRRKKTHSNCGTSLTFLTGTAGVLSGKCHCAGFTDINIPVFCQLCKIQPGLIVKKYLSLPFLPKVCYNDNGIFCNSLQ